MPSKLTSYDNATKKLMTQAGRFNVPDHNVFSLPEVVFFLRESFKYKLTRKKVLNFVIPNDRAHIATDFCKVASYYIYANTGGEEFWTLKETPLHWWLEYKQTGEIFDVTYDQFPEPFPYTIKPKAAPVFGKDALFTEHLINSAKILGQCTKLDSRD